MKSKVALLAVALALTACGGNYSNADLAYLNAFPTRQELQSKVPETGTTTGALNQRQDALSVGDISKTYRDTKAASVAFNGFLELFFSIIEEVRRYPPTSREDNRRVWGPFPAEKNPGWNAQVVMVRADETHFDWFIQFRKQSAAKTDPWLTGASGKFASTTGIRKGTGEMHLFLDKLRENGLTDKTDDGKLNSIDVTYVTDQPPLTVDIQLSGTEGASLDYSFREYEPGRATMWFVLDRPRTPDEPLRPHERLTVRSGWNTDGAGRATIFYENLTAAPPQTATGEECWDSTFRVVFFVHPWETPAAGGDKTKCVTVEGI